MVSINVGYKKLGNRVVQFMKEDYQRTIQDMKEVKKKGLSRILNSDSCKNFQNLCISTIPGTVIGSFTARATSFFVQNPYLTTTTSVLGAVIGNFSSFGFLSYKRGVTSNLESTLKHVKDTFIKSLPLTAEYIGLKYVVQPYLIKEFSLAPQEASIISDAIISATNSAILTYSTHGFFGKRKKEKCDIES